MLILRTLLFGAAHGPLWLRFRRWGNPVPLENVADRLFRDVVTEVGQCARDSIVPPAGVLLGHANNERLDRQIHTRAPRIESMLRAVELASNQTPIQARMVAGLARQATSRRSFRPRRWPISASEHRLATDSRSFPETCGRRIRFSATKYSH